MRYEVLDGCKKREREEQRSLESERERLNKKGRERIR